MRRNRMDRLTGILIRSAPSMAHKGIAAEVML